ncbi:MAG: YdcF family protein [Eubacteriales bacterium]|nr:YdcF family protein [Eubacteriales bacterium]
MYGEFLKEAENFIFAEDTPSKSDVIFVPGNGYPQMAERAAQLYREGYAPYILPSGKYSVTDGHFTGVLGKKECYPGEFNTEWEFLKEVLVRCGVPEKAVLKEDQATFTYENAIFSRQVTDQAGIKVKKAILCCKTYHARRSLMYYQLLYPEAELLVCPSCPDSITRSNWRDTEEGIDAVTGEITRIIKQFSLMLDYK